MATSKSNFWSSPLTRSRITSDDVKMPEMLLGYFIGPFGALLSSGIFTSILQNYFTDVLKLDLGFLTTLQLISTVLIVAANLVVGQLIERTREGFIPPGHIEVAARFPERSRPLPTGRRQKGCREGS